MKKIEQVEKIGAEQNLSFEIEVDGGVNARDCETYVFKRELKSWVGRSAIFKQKNRAEAIKFFAANVKGWFK